MALLGISLSKDKKMEICGTLAMKAGSVSYYYALFNKKVDFTIKQQRGPPRKLDLEA